MSTAINPEHIITQVKRLVESDKRSEIRLNANGGNSILLVCPPNLEYQFIVKLNELMGAEYSIIDLHELLISFVETIIASDLNIQGRFCLVVVRSISQNQSFP